MTRTARWTLAIAAVMTVVLGALVVELTQSRDPDVRTGQTTAPEPRERRSADSAAALAGPRAQADLAPCPVGVADDPGPEQLRDVTVQCAADGVSVNVARAVAGRPTVLNLWAYWCGPCAEELPAMAEYQRRVGPDNVLVLTVHQDENEQAALLRLAELGVHLPTLQDGQRRVAAALRVPNVMPATVVLRADGTVAQILPRAFSSADEIEDAVGDLR